MCAARLFILDRARVLPRVGARDVPDDELLRVAIEERAVAVGVLGAEAADAARLEE